MFTTDASAIFDCMIDGIVVTDKYGQIQVVNNAVTQMFGYAKDELVGLPVEKLMPPSYDGKHESFVRDYLRDGQPKVLGMRRELLAQRSNGEIFPIYIAVTETIQDRENIFVGVLRDLSASNDSEYFEQEQRAQLAQVGRLIAMGELTASIAHEVNQPLTAISMYAKACQKMLDADMVNRDLMRSTLQKLADQSLRAGAVIERIQQFVKTSDQARALVNLNGALVEIQHLVAGDALLHGIELVYEMTSEPIQVRCDANQIQQVALNLLRNAIEAMAEIDCQHGTQVTLTTKLQGSQIEVQVDDSGSGISESQLPHMFEAFHSTKSQGIGLGLSICKSIVEDHGGDITFANKENRPGCTFSFRLPIGEEGNA